MQALKAAQISMQTPALLFEGSCATRAADLSCHDDKNLGALLVIVFDLSQVHHGTRELKFLDAGTHL